MSCIALDHVNLRTANLAGMVEFYRQVLGLESGQRPPFDFPGAWLYCGGQAIVHLVEVPQPPATRAPRLEHFAVRGGGDLAGFLRRLDTLNIPYQIGIVPEWNIRQVNIFDPDGNHLHVDFATDEPLPSD